MHPLLVDSKSKAKSASGKSENELFSEIEDQTFILDQLNSHVFSLYKIPQLAASDIPDSYHFIQQISSLLHNSQFMMNLESSKLEFPILYYRFIKTYLNCLKNIPLPDHISIQIYAAFAPILCIYLKKAKDNDFQLSISLSDFINLLSSNEEPIDIILHFLSDYHKFELSLEKLVTQFTSLFQSDESQNSISEKYKSVIDSLKELQQSLSPRPTKSDDYSKSISMINDIKHNLIAFCESQKISREMSSILLLLSNIETVLNYIRLTYLSKENLKALIQIVSKNNFDINDIIVNKFTKRLAEDIRKVYLKQVKSLKDEKHSTFCQQIEKILKIPNQHVDNPNEFDLNLEQDLVSSFLAILPEYYDNSLIEEMSNSFSTVESLNEMSSLNSYSDVFQLYMVFCREADDFHKEGKLHRDLMSNLIIAESEIILTTFSTGNIKQTNKPIITSIEKVLAIMKNITAQPNPEVILRFLEHVLKILKLFFKTIDDEDTIQQMKAYLVKHLPSLEVLEPILGIKQKIFELFSFIKQYNLLQNQKYVAKTSDEILEMRDKEENYEICLIEKQRQIPELILRQIDILLSFKDLPTEYSKLVELIGGSSENSFENFHFEQDLFNISDSIYCLFCYDNGSFEYDNTFFLTWITFLFSMLDSPDEQITAEQFVEFIPFFDFSNMITTSIFTFNIAKAITHDYKEITEAIESFRNYALDIILNVAFKSLNLRLYSNAIKEITKKMAPQCYRRIERCISVIEPNIIIFALIINMRNILNKRYPSCTFDCKPMNYFNYVLSIYRVLKNLINANLLNQEYKDLYNEIIEESDDIFNADLKTLKFFSTEAYHNIEPRLINFLSKVKKLIDSFDLSLLIETGLNYIYSLSDILFNQPEQTLPSETIQSLLSLKLHVEDLTHKQAFFEKLDSISLILYTLLNIKQQPEDSMPLYHEFLDITNSAFLNYNLTEIVILLQHIFCQQLGFLPVYESDKEYSNVKNELDSILEVDNFPSVSNIIQPLCEQMSELRSCIDLSGISKNEKMKNILSDFHSMFETFSETVSPFLSSDESIESEIQEISNEIKECAKTLKQQREQRKISMEESERTYRNVRLSCIELRNANEVDLQQLKKLRVNVISKRKLIEEIQQQIDDKEIEMKEQNEKTPPAMKQKQKQEFTETIRAFRELIKPSSVDPDLKSTLTHQIEELNENNTKLRNENQHIDTQHRTTKEDEIELLIATDIQDDNFSLLQSENGENENESLKTQIREIEQSIERINKQKKKKQSQKSTSIDALSDLSTDEIIPDSDLAFLQFLHASRSVLSNSSVTYDDFQEFRQKTMERIQNMIKERRQLMEERNQLIKNTSKS